MFFRCGGGVDTSVVTAKSEDVLVGKVIVNADGDEVVGSMPTFETLTSANATSSDILTGKEAYVNGKKVAGSIKVNEEPIIHTLPADGCYDINSNTFYKYGGQIWAKSLASQTQATATPGDILSGQTAYVDGQKITGTLQKGKRMAKGKLQLTGYIKSSGTFTFYGGAVISGLSFRPSFIYIDNGYTPAISTKCVHVLISEENYSSRVFYQKPNSYDMQEEQHNSKKVVRNSTGATITLENDVYFLGGRDENGNELDYEFIAYE